MGGNPVYRTIREQIAEHIRSDVLSGRLPQGAPLREQALAKRFGVSRGPIRDALLQLTQEGLLISKPNCGTTVSSPPGERIQPLVVDVRRKVEVFALRSVLKQLEEQSIARLDGALDALRSACESGDLSAVASNDMAFHRTLVELAGEEELVAIWLPIVSRMMLHYRRNDDWMESYAEHAAIVEAIRGRDLKAAIAALQENIQ